MDIDFRMTNSVEPKVAAPEWAHCCATCAKTEILKGGKLWCMILIDTVPRTYGCKHYAERVEDDERE